MTGRGKGDQTKEELRETNSWPTERCAPTKAHIATSDRDKQRRDVDKIVGQGGGGLAKILLLSCQEDLNCEKERDQRRERKSLTPEFRSSPGTLIGLALQCGIQ